MMTVLLCDDCGHPESDCICWQDPETPPRSDPPGTCDWGDCDEIATRWRWSDDHAGWLPVCDWHDLNDV